MKGLLVPRLLISDCFTTAKRSPTMAEYQLKVMSVTQGQTFSSRLTTVLTMTGVAVGLGNVWRFPYMMGRYGGSAFLLIFLFFVLAFAVPAAMAEWSLGRATRQGPMGAFSTAFGRRWGRPVGVVLTLTVLIANSYYLLVIAYICFTGWFSVWHGFEAQNLEDYKTGLGLGWLQYTIAALLLVSCLWVLSRGLRKGIERVSLFFLPFFGVVVIVFIFYSLSLEGCPGILAAFPKTGFFGHGFPRQHFRGHGPGLFLPESGGNLFCDLRQLPARKRGPFPVLHCSPAWEMRAPHCWPRCLSFPSFWYSVWKWTKAPL